MNNTRIRLFLWTLAATLIVLTVFCSELSILSSPPSYSAVQKRFTNNWKNIETIEVYLTESRYSSIDISNFRCTKVFADFDHIDITDVAVRHAVRSLLLTGRYKNISKSQNTIVIEQWSNIGDIGCGIAYSIDSDAEPVIEYVTELQPLNEDGWYYYISDYNQWRTQPRQER